MDHPGTLELSETHSIEILEGGKAASSSLKGTWPYPTTDMRYSEFKLHWKLTLWALSYRQKDLIRFLPVPKHTDRASPAAVFCWAGPGGIPPREKVKTLRPPKSWVACWMTLEWLPSTWSTVAEPFLTSWSVCHWPSDSTASPMVRSTFPPTPASEM